MGMLWDWNSVVATLSSEWGVVLSGQGGCDVRKFVGDGDRNTSSPSSSVLKTVYFIVSICSWYKCLLTDVYSKPGVFVGRCGPNYYKRLESRTSFL